MKTYGTDLLRKLWRGQYKGIFCFLPNKSEPQHLRKSIIRVNIMIPKPTPIILKAAMGRKQHGCCYRQQIGGKYSDLNL